MRLSKTRFMFLVPHLVFPFPSVKAQANVQTFWSDYPPCEESCHESVFNSQQCSLENSCGCSGCLCLADSCLCETSSWLIAVAQCIGKSCGSGDVTTAASIAQSACNGNGFALAVGSAALISYGMAAIPTSTQAPPQTTTSAQPQVVTTSDTPTSAPLTSNQAPTSSAPTTFSSTAATSSPSTTPPPDSTTDSTPELSTTLSTTSRSISSPSSPTSSQSSSSSPSPETLTGIILPTALCGVTILAAFIFWLVKREIAIKWFRNLCCCCCVGFSDESRDLI